MDPARIPEEFPAPSLRDNQGEALAAIREAFAAGNEVVLVRAPTGSGKSLLAGAVCGAARRPGDASPGRVTGAYYTTPQVSQLEDVAADDLLREFAVVRGKRNYRCILPGEHDTRVDRAPCVRRRGFDCTVRGRCPYFADRNAASESGVAAMTLAYFMRTAGSEAFGPRDVVVVDEAHGLAEWAEMYATIDLRPETVPVWEEVGVPDVAEADDPVGRAARFAESLAGVCERARESLTGRPELSPEEAARRDRLGELRSELSWFVEEYRDPDSPTTWVVDQSDEGALTVKPLDPERHLRHTLWDRADRFALFSATILNKRAFCRGVGLDPADVALVDVDHTFPLSHRPLYDVTRGRMTYEEREGTLPALARMLVRLMARHPDEKGLVHAHSYDIANRLRDRLVALGVGDRLRVHDRENRDGELAAWKASTEPEVFLSVKMEEALDLRGDQCRWQVLCKAPYPNTNDSRVERRLEDGQWGWYYRRALRTVIQACGRVVRAPDDHGATYLGDSSLLDLFERARTDMPDWFAAQVDAIERPSLPALDAEAALSCVDADPNGRRSGAPDRSGGGAGTRTDADAADREDHPLSDVWGDR